MQRIRDYVTEEWRWSTVAWVAGETNWPLHRAVAEEEKRVIGELGGVSRRVGRALRPDSVTGGVPSIGSATKSLRGDDGSALSLVALMRRLGNRAKAAGRGVLIVVDELQNGSRDVLAGLNLAFQLVSNEERLPVSLLAAGLPTTPRVLRGAKATYIERQDKIQLGNLDPRATGEALELPFEQAGRRISPAALDLLADASGGYPYAIQLYGKFTWRQAGDRPTVTVADARAGSEVAAAKLVENVYEGRWEDLVGRERRYLVAYVELAPGPAGARTADLAERLGGDLSDWSDIRDSLINVRHLMRQSERGRVVVDLPGFVDWLTAHRDVPLATPSPTDRSLGLDV